MEITDTDIQMPDSHCPDFLSLCIKQEHDDREADFNEIKAITAAQHLCTIEIKEFQEYTSHYENRLLSTGDESNVHNIQNSGATNSNLNPLQQREGYMINSVFKNSVYLGSLDLETSDEIQRQANKISQAFLDQQEHSQHNISALSTVTVANDFLENFNFNIKKETSKDIAGIYSMAWLNNVSNDIDISDTNDSDCRVHVPSDIEATIKPIGKNKHCISNSNISSDELVREKSKKTTKSKSVVLLNYKERLRKKAECMREKRRKLYLQETEEDRLQRLAKEAAKKRESRMYYETPEQRRKRLDTEAARKREYRMYNETPEDRRNRLDREAERRRLKRLSLYSRETPEQRRERLDRESAKRREARLNQYAKETDEQRKSRLKREALRAREIRFTRSAIETEEERSQRLVKEALRKREVRMRRARSSSDSLTELRTVRNFEELNNAQLKDGSDNLLGGHYLSNWVMWLQNSLVQPIYHEEGGIESQSRNSG